MRQGKIFSLVLFSIYLSDSSVLLDRNWNKMRIEGSFFNHLLYAGNLYLMASCGIALQVLINMCYKHSIEIDLHLIAFASYCITLKLIGSIPLKNLHFA